MKSNNNYNDETTGSIYHDNAIGIYIGIIIGIGICIDI